MNRGGWVSISEEQCTTSIRCSANSSSNIEFNVILVLKKIRNTIGEDGMSSASILVLFDTIKRLSFSPWEALQMYAHQQG